MASNLAEHEEVSRKVADSVGTNDHGAEEQQIEDGQHAEKNHEQVSPSLPNGVMEYWVNDFNAFPITSLLQHSITPSLLSRVLFQPGLQKFQDGRLVRTQIDRFVLQRFPGFLLEAFDGIAAEIGFKDSRMNITLAANRRSVA